MLGLVLIELILKLMTSLCWKDQRTIRGIYSLLSLTLKKWVFFVYTQSTIARKIAVIVQQSISTFILSVYGDRQIDARPCYSIPFCVLRQPLSLESDFISRAHRENAGGHP